MIDKQMTAIDIKKCRIDSIEINRDITGEIELFLSISCDLDTLNELKDQLNEKISFCYGDGVFSGYLRSFSPHLLGEAGWYYSDITLRAAEYAEIPKNAPKPILIKKPEKKFSPYEICTTRRISI